MQRAAGQREAIGEIAVFPPEHEILVEPAGIPDELRVEMQAWDKASDEAWAMIEKWEAEER